MMKAMKALIALLYLLQSVWAQSPQSRSTLTGEVIYNPGGNKPGRFVVSYNGYEDLRIDSNLDGKVDYWRVKKGFIQVETYFRNGIITTHSVRKTDGPTVLEYLYRNINGTLRVSKARVRKPYTMGFAKTSLCESKLQELQSKLKDFKTELDEELVLIALDENLVDPNCKKVLSRQEYNQLLGQLARQLSGNPDPLNDCLNNPKFKAAVGSSPENHLAVEILKANYELQRKQLSTQSAAYKPTIKCQLSKSPDNYKPATTHEDGSITLFKTTDDSGASKFPIQREHLDHEFLHRLGIIDESKIAGVLKTCENLDNPNKGENLSLVAETPHGFAPVIGNVAAAEKELNTSLTANVTSDVAEAPTLQSPGIQQKDVSANIPVELPPQEGQIPSVATLSESLTYPTPNTEVGSRAALARSVSESSGMLRTANNLLGAMSSPAKATTPKIALPGSSALVSKNSIGKDERIVESITLDDTGASQSLAAKAETGRKSESRSPASTTPLKVDIQQSGETASGSTSAGASASGALPSGSSVPGTANRAPNSARRSPSSLAQSNGSPSTKDEVITFISNGDYASAKRKLKDPDFNKQLVSQKITVLDLYGNSFGAKKGQVVFLDEGNRFVRQK